MKSTKQQRERAKFIQHLIEIVTPAQKRAAAKAAGLKDPRVAERIARSLQAHGSIRKPGPRGPKTKFTAAVLKHAYDVLSDPQYEWYTSKTLRDKLIEDHVLDPPVDTDNLLSHLKAYCKQHGHELLTTATGTIFEITPANKAKRVQWCKDVKAQLKKNPLTSWMFDDEVAIEQDPHPKCECCLCTLQQQQHTHTHTHTHNQQHVQQQQAQHTHNTIIYPCKPFCVCTSPACNSSTCNQHACVLLLQLGK
jgi:hypothetical protein